jgi:hypothetical protein
MAEPGPLTQRVLAYVATMRDLVPTAAAPEDWAPLEAFVAVDDFERVGTFMEVQDWAGYTGMLTKWGGSIGRFEPVVRRITEVDRLVYYEVEERHFRGEDPHIVNSLTVFAFDDQDRICHLDVFLQQPPPAR